MDWRNRIGLYGSYFFGMAAIGFTLPYLPLYLGEKGLSDRAIGIVSTLAALSGLAQFPVGLWSDRIGWRKPFLVVALAVAALSTVLLRGAHGVVWLGFLVILFAENGICRAVVESLSGAEAAALAPPGGVGAALGALRFWKPIGIVLVALLGSWMSERYGVGAILMPLAVVQGLAVAAALLIHETPSGRASTRTCTDGTDVEAWMLRAASGWLPERRGALGLRGGDGPVPRRERARRRLPGAVPQARPARPGADARLRLCRQHGRLDAGRLAGGMAGRPLGTQAALDRGLGDHGAAAGAWSPSCRARGMAVANQALDGLGNGLFAVVAAAWVTDRLADPRRSGEAQVIVGSCLVFGSAIGPAAAGFLVGPLGYRGPVRGSWRASGRSRRRSSSFFVPETLARSDECSGRPGRRPDGHDVRSLDCSVTERSLSGTIWIQHWNRRKLRP